MTPLERLFERAGPAGGGAAPGAGGDLRRRLRRRAPVAVRELRVVDRRRGRAGDRRRVGQADQRRQRAGSLRHGPAARDGRRRARRRRNVSQGRRARSGTRTASIRRRATCSRSCAASWGCARIRCWWSSARRATINAAPSGARGRADRHHARRRGPPAGRAARGRARPRRRGATRPGPRAARQLHAEGLQAILTEGGPSLVGRALSRWAHRRAVPDGRRRACSAGTPVTAANRWSTASISPGRSRGSG